MMKREAVEVLAKDAREKITYMLSRYAIATQVAPAFAGPDFYESSFQNDVNEFVGFLCDIIRKLTTRHASSVILRTVLELEDLIMAHRNVMSDIDRVVNAYFDNSPVPSKTSSNEFSE